MRFRCDSNCTQKKIDHFGQTTVRCNSTSADNLKIKNKRKKKKTNWKMGSLEKVFQERDYIYIYNDKQSFSFVVEQLTKY